MGFRCSVNLGKLHQTMSVWIYLGRRPKAFGRCTEEPVTQECLSHCCEGNDPFSLYLGETLYENDL